MKATALTLSSITLAFLTCAPAIAQQITSVPGSPSATTTIDGAQIPPPPQKFEGKEQCQMWGWPPRSACTAAEGNNSLAVTLA